MATGPDRLAGLTLVGIAAICFLYYTVWLIILPFVDKDQAIHTYFPDKFYAIAVPLSAGVCGLFLIAGYLIVVMLKPKSDKKKQ